MKEKKEKESKDSFKSALSQLKSIKNKERKQEKEFISNRIEHPEQREKLNYQRGLQQKEIGKEKTTARMNVVTGYAERTGERVSKGISKALKQKILKKPSVQLVKPISSTSLLKSFARTNYARVQPAQERVYADDHRSLFFNSEYNQEKKRMGGFL